MRLIATKKEYFVDNPNTICCFKHQFRLYPLNYTLSLALGDFTRIMPPYFYVFIVGNSCFMRKLLTSPNAMSLSATEQTIYQNALSFVADLSLNLMAVKVANHPDNFLSWCSELYRICLHDVNRDLLEPSQERPLKKLQDTLSNGVSACQLKLAGTDTVR